MANRKVKGEAIIMEFDYKYTRATIIHGKWITRSRVNFSSPQIAKNQIRKFCEKHSIEIVDIRED